MSSDDDFLDLLNDIQPVGTIPDDWVPPSGRNVTKQMDLPSREVRERSRIIISNSVGMRVSIAVIAAVVMALVAAVGWILWNQLHPSPSEPPMSGPTVTVTTTSSASTQPVETPSTPETPPMPSSTNTGGHDQPATTTQVPHQPLPSETTAPSSSETTTTTASTTTTISTTTPVSRDTSSRPPATPQSPTISSLKCERNGLSVTFTLLYNVYGTSGTVTINVSSDNNPGIPSTFPADAQYASGSRHLATDEPVTCSATVTSDVGTANKITTTN